MIVDNVKLGHSIGWSFTPLNGKRPTLSGWQKRSKEKLETALRWAKNGNVGIRCGKASAPDGKYLIGIDQDKGGDVSHLNLPPTVTVITGSGTRHYYFYSSVELGNSARKLGEGIDTRGEGGQLVFAGSIHPETGKLYEWESGLSPTDIGVADLPDHVVTLLVGEKKKSSPKKPKQEKPASSKQAYGRKAMASECKAVCAASEGSRNEQLNKSAFSIGTLVAIGCISEQEAQTGLLAAALDAGLKRTESLATIQSGLSSGLTKPRQLKDKPQKITKTLALTDLGNAERFSHYYGDMFRYCPESGAWYLWAGKNWGETSNQHQLCAHKIPDMIWDEWRNEKDEDRKDEIAKWINMSQSRAKLDAITHIAKFQLSTPVNRFDQHILKFNVQNGTLNLATCQLDEHNPSDYLTMVAPVEFDPNAKCNLWLKFLKRSLVEDDMIEYHQRLMGMMLSGEITEQIFPILHGDGGNGKSVFLDTICALMGPYACQPRVDLVAEKGRPSGDHPTELAQLKGKRLCAVSEPEEGSRLKMATIKYITGNSTINARYMRQDNFEYQRQFKVVMATNPRPIVPTNDGGTWRRIKLLPWTEVIPDSEKDPQLIDKLKNEWSGILNWLFEGYRKWRESGIGSVTSIKAATDDYQMDYDSLGEFIGECCHETRSDEDFIISRELRSLYVSWCESGHRRPMGLHTFNDQMRRRNLRYVTKRNGNSTTKAWAGIRTIDINENVAY